MDTTTDTASTPVSPTVSTTTDNSSGKKVPFKKKGNPFMSPRQTHHARRGCGKIKRYTQMLKENLGKVRLTPEEKSACAFFADAYMGGGRQEYN